MISTAAALEKKTGSLNCAVFYLFSSMFVNRPGRPITTRPVPEMGAIVFNTAPMPTPPSADKGLVISFFSPLIEV